MTNTGQPDFREVRYDVAAGTATMTLHRPDRLNAFTRTMAGELVAAFDLADADDAVRVVLLAGGLSGYAVRPGPPEGPPAPC